MAAPESTPYNFEEEFEAYLHRIFYIKPYTEESKCDPSIVEYFGVFSLTDIRAPERKLWYIYYCKQPDIDETVDRIFQKYGKKNMCELFRKPIFSGVSLRTRVKTHFSELKWYVKGNLLEAPPKSHYNDERMAKTITDLYNDERKMLYNYICMKHNAFIRRGLQHEGKGLFGLITSHQSSDTSASSSDSCRYRPACLSELDIYDNRHHSHYKKKSSPQHRRSPSRSGSEAPRSRHHSDRKSEDRQRMRQARDRPQPSRCIGVFGLAIHTTQQQVRELFNKFGKIERIQMVIDAHTRRSRGFCFIYFENLNDARTAKDACTGMDVDGRRIRVDYSITQRAHTPTPGVYMGQPSRSARIRSRDEGSRDGSRSRRRYREVSSSVSPYDSHRRRYRSRHRYERSRTRSRSRSRSYSRSPRKSRVTPRY